jgi:hypothetical protein
VQRVARESRGQLAERRLYRVVGGGYVEDSTPTTQQHQALRRVLVEKAKKVSGRLDKHKAEVSSGRRRKLGAGTGTQLVIRKKRETAVPMNSHAAHFIEPTRCDSFWTGSAGTGVSFLTCACGGREGLLITRKANSTSTTTAITATRTTTKIQQE